MSVAQRRLSSPARELRRRTSAVTGLRTARDGSTEPLTVPACWRPWTAHSPRCRWRWCSPPARSSRRACREDSGPQRTTGAARPYRPVHSISSSFQGIREDQMSESPVDPRDPGARRIGVVPIIAISVAVLLILLVAGAYAYDQSRSDVIAKGVKVAGVDVGGLERAAAQRKVEAELTQQTRLGRDGHRGLAALDTERARSGAEDQLREHDRAGRQRQPRRLVPEQERKGSVRGERQPRNSPRGQLLARRRPRA